jgi:signal transduction histidine kinase
MRTEKENKRLIEKIALLEEELEATRTRMQTLQAVILSNISHDIRTPMNAIVGFANLLTNAEMDIEERVDCIDHLNNHSIELLEIIDNMIDASQLQCGGIKLYESELYVNDILDEILENSKASKNIAHKKLGLAVSKGEDNDFSIYADPRRLRQIFHNLIDNAAKFTNNGHIEIGYFQRIRGQVTFFVKDTGAGLGSLKKEDLFKPFRSESSSRNNGSLKGAGLGLAISKSLVVLMGGEIWPESVNGQGTCFYFTLPAKKHTFLENTLKQVRTITNRNIASFF